MQTWYIQTNKPYQTRSFIIGIFCISFVAQNWPSLDAEIRRNSLINKSDKLNLSRAF